MNPQHFTLTAAHALPQGVLHLTFADGVMLQVDVMPIVRKHPTLQPLSNPDLFWRVKVGPWGGSVHWGEMMHWNWPPTTCASALSSKQTAMHTN